jgi:hypothetical protein
MNRVPACEKLSGEGVEEPEVLAVAEQHDDDAAFAAVGQPGVVKDPALQSVEVPNGGSYFQSSQSVIL